MAPAQVGGHVSTVTHTLIGATLEVSVLIEDDLANKKYNCCKQTIILSSHNIFSFKDYEFDVNILKLALPMLISVVDIFVSCCFCFCYYCTAVLYGLTLAFIYDKTLQSQWAPLFKLLTQHDSRELFSVL